MKQLMMIVLVTMQTIISSAALAWSPVDEAEQIIDKMQHCLFVTASGEEGQQEQKAKAEEEEEPDCE